jgi:hypothetical protein
MKMDLYKQNQNLSTRLVNSIILYLDDTINMQLSYDARQQSKAAVLTLLDTALEVMNADLSKEAQEILTRIFSKTIYDVVREDKENIMKDMRSFREILKIV